MSELESDYFKENLNQIIEDIGRLVNKESPSRSIPLLKECADEIQALVKERLNLKMNTQETEQGKPILTLEIGDAQEKKPVLILCHYDTVHLAGTITEIPFSIENGIMRGPGTFDMKVGLVQGLWVLKFLKDNNVEQRPIIFMCTPDEEIGSSESRKIILENARNAEYAIVLEASAQGMIKTGRKGTGRFRIAVTGRAAHAGLEPEKGINAIAEISHLVLKLQDLNKNDKGTTVNVGTISGGTTSNVVPANAELTIDIRVWSQEEADRISKFLHNMKLENPEAKLKVEGEFDRPPMVPTPKTEALVSRIKGIAKDLGRDLEDTSVGGASDGNLVAPLGVPVLDGFGAVGGGAHSREEFVNVEEIPFRALLLSRVLELI